MVSAFSLRSSTERHGDFSSESVVFHFLTRCPVGFWVFVCGCFGFCCFVFWSFQVTPRFLFHF